MWWTREDKRGHPPRAPTPMCPRQAFTQEASPASARHRTQDAAQDTGRGAWDTGRGVQRGLQDTGPGPSRDSDNPAPGPVLPHPHLALQVEVDERLHVLDVSVKLVGRVLTKETFLGRRGQEPSAIRKSDPSISLDGGLPAPAGARGPVAPCTHTCNAGSWGAGAPGGRGRRKRPREESSRMTCLSDPLPAQASTAVGTDNRTAPCCRTSNPQRTRTLA